MLNALIISSNLKFIEKFANSLDTESLDIGIRGIANKYYQIHDILRRKKIDIIFLDTDTTLSFSNIFWKKYSPKTINLTIEDLFSKNVKVVLDKISNFAIDANLNRKKNKADLILDELKYLGYKIKYKGTPLLAAAILEVFNHPNNGFDNFENHIFPIIAKKYNSTFANVKSAVNNATLYMYRDCNIDRLKNYFHFYEDIKPGVKEVATEVYNRVRKKL